MQQEIAEAVELIENIDPDQLDFDNLGGEEIKENEEDRIFLKDDNFVLEILVIIFLVLRCKMINEFQYPRSQDLNLMKNTLVCAEV